MLEKITESLVASEFYGLSSKQDRPVKLFFLDFLRFPYISYINVDNMESAIISLWIMDLT